MSERDINNLADAIRDHVGSTTPTVEQVLTALLSKYWPLWDDLEWNQAIVTAKARRGEGE